MPYQEPGTCRFFVDQLLWLHSLGLGKSDSDYASNVFDLNPATISIQGSGSANYDMKFNTTTSLHGLNYIAILGHNMASGQHNFNLAVMKDGVAIANPMGYGLNNDVSINNTWNWTAGGNASGTDAALIPEYDGFSIMMSNTKYDIDYAYDQLMFYNITETYDWKVGCLSLGSFYDMPHSADLKISMERQIDGVQKVRTRGGNDLVDYRYHKPPMWGSLGAWELIDPANTTDQDLQPLSRSGRRIWNLSFSYLQDSDIFPVSSSVNWEGVYPDNTSNHNLLLEDDTFYGQVIHKCHNLPFIFQPDVNDNTNFAIAKFDMNSFQFSQQAPNLYRISLKIREVW